MSIKKISNYNTGIDLTAISISEATYMLNSFIEESINDLQIKCLLADKRSLNESGVRYFTEENDTGKQKLGDKIKQIIKTVWDVIVGIFKKIRDFFKDMITKIKDFFSKIQQKFFGKKEDKKEEPKSAEKPAEKKEESKPETKPVEKKDESKKRPFNTEKINTTQDEYGLYQVDQKELIRYMKDLNDKVFRDSVDKNISIFYDTKPFIDLSESLARFTFNIDSNWEYSSNDPRSELGYARSIVNSPLTKFELDTKYIDKKMVLDCAFGDFSIFYKEVDSDFKYAEKIFDNLTKNSNKVGQEDLPKFKELLKLTTACSKKYSTVMIHNTKGLMKVVHYIYNNYDRDGVSVKESADWSSIL